jgi:hypothetical protein
MIKKTAIERAVIVPASHFLFVTRGSIFALLVINSDGIGNNKPEKEG